MAEKKYDSDIIGWYTKNGKRIPLRKGESHQKAKKGDPAENRRKWAGKKRSSLTLATNKARKG